MTWNVWKKLWSQITPSWLWWNWIWNRKWVCTHVQPTKNRFSWVIYSWVTPGCVKQYNSEIINHWKPWFTTVKKLTHFFFSSNSKYVRSQHFWPLLMLKGVAMKKYTKKIDFDKIQQFVLIAQCFCSLTHKWSNSNLILKSQWKFGGSVFHCLLCCQTARIFWPWKSGIWLLDLYRIVGVSIWLIDGVKSCRKWST